MISASVSTHIFLLSFLAYVLAVSGFLRHFQLHHSPLYKWDDSWGPKWDRAKNVLAFPYTVLSSLFLFPTYRMIRVDLHDFIYKMVNLPSHLFLVYYSILDVYFPLVIFKKIKGPHCDEHCSFHFRRRADLLKTC